jgi:glutathione S-transferase
MNRQMWKDHGVAPLSKLRVARLCMRLRTALRLCAPGERVQFLLSHQTDFYFFHSVPAAIHRVEENIGGRLYLIEASAVAADRWRACIVRVPGVPTALMPFYGRTPDEAVQHLSDWLTRAHQRAAEPPRPV